MSTVHNTQCSFYLAGNNVCYELKSIMWSLVWTTTDKRYDYARNYTP